VVAFFDNLGPNRPFPLRAMVALLANSLRKVHQTAVGRVGLLTISPYGTATQSVQALTFGDTDVVTLATSTITTQGRLRAVVEGMNCSYVLVDMGATGDVMSDWVQDCVLPVVTKVVVFGGDLEAPIWPLIRDKHIIRTVLLHHDEPGDYVAYYPGTVRLEFNNLDHLERITNLDGDLPERDTKSFERLARAVAEVRVGLALGGGAAWGFSHIALIEQLIAYDMPIDIISGVSFGSLAGAFYAAADSKGLDYLVKHATRFQLALFGSIAIPPLAAATIDWYLGERRLEYLALPFFPIGLDVDSGEEFSPARGTVGEGVRSASQIPGLLPPLIKRKEGRRLVDGMFVNNVPESVLVRERADYIIASDVVPPALRSSETFWSPFWSFVSPFSKLNDNVRAVGTLIEVVNNRDRDVASRKFAPYAGAGMLDFYKAEQIVERTRPDAEKFARSVRNAYLDSTLFQADRTPR
jgi:predicted acylesterase/phospholipase RssA